jgi:hypothetical protein
MMRSYRRAGVGLPMGFRATKGGSTNPMENCKFVTGLTDSHCEAKGALVPSSQVNTRKDAEDLQEGWPLSGTVLSGRSTPPWIW